MINYEASQYQICWWSTDPVQLIALRVKQSIDFLHFSVKKRFLWCHQKTANFFTHLNGWEASSCIQTQSSKVWCKRNSGYWFVKYYSLTPLKNTLLAIPFSLLRIRTQFSEYWRVPASKHCLISLIWIQEQYLTM